MQSQAQLFKEISDGLSSASPSERLRLVRTVLAPAVSTITANSGAFATPRAREEFAAILLSSAALLREENDKAGEAELLAACMRIWRLETQERRRLAQLWAQQDPPPITYEAAVVYAEHCHDPDRPAITLQADQRVRSVLALAMSDERIRPLLNRQIAVYDALYRVTHPLIEAGESA